MSDTAIHRLGEGPLGEALAAVVIGNLDDAHQLIALAAAVPVSAAAYRTSLFSGAPALAYVLHHAYRPEYADALAALDTVIEEATRRRLSDAFDRIKGGDSPKIAEYDLISGLTGLGLYQLLRHPSGDLLPGVLSYLVALTEPRRLDTEVTVPGWWASGCPTAVVERRFAAGHANFGMAHGIAGPFALLSAAMSYGIEVKGQLDAIERICAHFDSWEQHDSDASWWPEFISLFEHRHGAPDRSMPGRPSWCYGVPGIARAQQLAADAIGQPSRAEHARLVFLQALNDTRQLEQLTDAGLCHGWAGLLVTAKRILGDDPPDTTSSTALRTLLRELEDHLAHFRQPDDNSLLLGRAGIRLASARVCTADPATSRTRQGWDACLLLTFPTPETTTEPPTP